MLQPHRFLVATAILAGLLASCGTTHPESPRLRLARTHRTVVPNQIRAVWVDSWGPGLYDRAQCDALISWCRRYGFNTILAEVRKVGDAYYESRLEPRGRNEAAGAVIPPTFDPLGYLAERLDAMPGMRLEAWIVAQRIWKGKAEPPATAPAHVAIRHPEWLLVSEAGTTRSSDDPSVYLDPSDPGARAWTARVAADIARNYAVDAIHLDYIRYPDKQWGYGKRSLARYFNETGATTRPKPDDPGFTAWRARQVTQAVREIREAVRRARPGCELTAATITWGAPSERGFHASAAYTRTMQDWLAWCDEGLVDVAYPMHYKREFKPEHARDYRSWFDVFAPHRGPGKARIVIGQGSYLNDIDDSMRQIDAALAAGFDGVSIFSYRTTNRGRADREAFGAALVAGPFAPFATP